MQSKSEKGWSDSLPAVWTNITVSPTGQSSLGGNVFVPQTPETFTYNEEGDLTSDGRWTNTLKGSTHNITHYVDNGGALWHSVRHATPSAS